MTSPKRSARGGTPTPCGVAEASIGERAAVWFSSADPWEPTASKVVNDDGTDETTLAAHHAITAVFRIGVAPETVPLGWAAWRGQSGATPETVAGLRRVAKRLGADPMRWRVSFEPVPRERWVRVEVWDGTRWTDNPTTFERELARAETVAAEWHDRLRARSRTILAQSTLAPATLPC